MTLDEYEPPEASGAVRRLLDKSQIFSVGHSTHESDEFVALLKQAQVGLSEAQWWRCHRRMVSDALVVRGWRVVHIDFRGEQAGHVLTEFAVVEGDEVAYPSPGKNSARNDADQRMAQFLHSSAGRPQDAAA